MDQPDQLEPKNLTRFGSLSQFGLWDRGPDELYPLWEALVFSLELSTPERVPTNNNNNKKENENNLLSVTRLLFLVISKVFYIKIWKIYDFARCCDCWEIYLWKIMILQDAVWFERSCMTIWVVKFLSCAWSVWALSYGALYLAFAREYGDNSLT